MLTSVDFEHEKIAVTKQQIFQYNLPYTPETEEEIRKLKEIHAMISLFNNTG
jgi:hypothetical protein